jgi:putative hemolysin
MISFAGMGTNRSFEFVDEVIKEFGVEVTCEGLENLPKEGGCIIASNHPIGGLDGMALMQVVAKVQQRSDFHCERPLTTS